MTDVLNPVAVEQAIRETADQIAKGVRIVSTAYAEFLAADHAYDVAFARAYLNYDGAAHARKYAAELETLKERQARDVADVAYQYARSTARALEDKLRAYQSVGASVRSMYGAAGRGES